MKIALCGLPLSGKSTVFKALVGKKNQSKTAASGKLQLNIGTLTVHDARLQELARIMQSQKVTYPQINLVDVAYSGEKTATGIDTAYLREFDALGLVIAAFSSPDPASDLANIESEFILADMQVIQNRMAKIKKESKARPKKEADPESSLLERCQQALEQERVLGDLGFQQQELKMLAGFQLLTLKPVIIIANISEEQLNKEAVDLQTKARKKDLKIISLCAQLEAEIEELPEAERPKFLQELGLKTLSQDKFLRICLKALNQVIFFTVVGKEARAWPVAQGTAALGAAGSVHSDMERGFIRAEVINYRDFVACGSFARAKEKGLLRLESKEYPVQDGDIINFKFSV